MRKDVASQRRQRRLEWLQSRRKHILESAKRRIRIDSTLQTVGPLYSVGHGIRAESRSLEEDDNTGDSN